MTKKIFVFIFLILSLFVDTLIAGPSIKVAIFPFSINASNSNVNIKNKIPLMLSEKLESEGANTILVKQFTDTESWNHSDFRKQGIKLGVDYILIGSVFMAGEGFSIDTKMVDIYNKNNISTFYSEAENIETLSSAIILLSKTLIGELFQKKIITDIAVTGNKRIEADAILRIIDTQAGDIVKADNISKDLTKIYNMGYFDDVIVKKESHDKGVKILFEVAEKPSVRRIKFKKNTIFEDQELADILDMRTGSILNLHKINSDVDRMRLMYTEKNYHNCTISYEIKPIENSQADIIFSFTEENKVKVEKITFEGNKYFSDKKIKKAMETSEKGFFSFFTSSGDLNETEVNNDVVRIESLYKNNGFIDTKVSDPVINIGEKFISIHFKINEGSQYKVKNVDIEGDLIVSKETLLEEIQSKESQLYNRELIRSDILAISDIYANKGYANANINPVVDKDEQEKMMTIRYVIDKNKLVYFNRINISGNLKTRDKVIRREIKIIEQDLYSKKNIALSFKNLNRLDYFSEIDINPVKTPDDDQMDLDVKIAEKETGSFSVGGGFSSDAGAFAMASVQERNLFGKGQTGRVSAKLSADEILYSISFFEPYIFDTSIAGGFDLYKKDVEYDFYDKEALGLTLKIGYKLFDYTRIGANYNIEDYNIKDVQPAHTSMTPGSFLTSSIRPYISYDSRNDMFLPTEGSKHKFSIEYAGEFLGGDIDYTKFLVETGIYFPLFWKFTGALHAEGGYLDDRSSDDVDIDFTRFYLGGINSIRGFDKYDIDGRRSGDTRQIGGEKYVQFNAEVMIPLTTKYKLAGVFFYDRGDVYRKSESFDFGDQYSSVGVGVRWDSPMGPLRVEYGWVIDGKTIKERGDGQVAFSVGAFF